MTVQPIIRPARYGDGPMLVAAHRANRPFHQPCHGAHRSLTTRASTLGGEALLLDQKPPSSRAMPKVASSGL